MKQYRDLLGKPIPKREVIAAVQTLLRTPKTESSTAMFLSRRIGVGYGKASRIVDVLEDAGVIGPAPQGYRPRPLILRKEAEAINAALRQLKKGKK